MNGFAPFLLAHGLFTQAEDYLLQAEQAARLLQDKAGLATALLYLVRIQWNRGDYNKAETTLQEGLALARQNADTEQICRLLNAFRELQRMTSDENQEYLAVALYGLARVAKARGDATGHPRGARAGA